MRKRRIVDSPINRQQSRHSNKSVARQLADQQVADGVMAMRKQRPDNFGVAPMLRVARQAESGSMCRCPGSAEIALWPHIEQPPRQSVAMKRHAVGLHHDKPARANRNERAKLPNHALIANAKNRGPTRSREKCPAAHNE